VFAATLCCPRQNRFSMPNCVVCSESSSLSKLCCLQWISVRCWSCVVCSGSVIRWRNRVTCSAISICCQKRVGCSEVAFAVEIEVPAANQFSLSNCVANNESISLSIFYNSPPGINDLNAYNNFIVWWCKMWNAWMWTYELLK